MPPGAQTSVAVEQGFTPGWERYVGSTGGVIAMVTLGAYAPLKELQRQLGFEPDKVVAAANSLLGRN
jgi:transketolase